MSSIFASLVTLRIPMPGDPEQFVTIRKLAPKHLNAAAKVTQMESLAALKEIGGAFFLKELQALGGEQVALAAVAADPLQKFDRLTLVEHGVTGWTYEHEPTRAFLEDNLDDDTLTALAREVLKLAKPTLYVDAEAEQKND
jgi:hypothetical protein